MPRLNYRKVLEEEASKNGIEVFYHNRSAQWGRAALGSKKVFVPNPVRFPSFFTALHELGHIMSRHHAADGKPEYRWEYEAFNWALQFCEKRGIPVPEKTINNEREIIAEKVRWDVSTGTKEVDPEVVRFVKEGSDEDPDVKFIKSFIRDDGVALLTDH